MCCMHTDTIQPVDKMSLNKPLEIHCSVNTADITNSDDVTISWTGPNGTTITNDSRLNITPTVSNGTNHICTLQFSYLSEDDEGLYECRSSVLGYDGNKTTSLNLSNFTSELIVPLKFNVISIAYLTEDDAAGPKLQYVIEVNTVLVVDADKFTGKIYNLF